MKTTTDKYSIKKIGFPDTLAPDYIKNTNEFGLGVANAILSEWFSRAYGASSRFYSSRDNYHLLRMYARGQQPVEKYKKEMSANGDLSYMNLNWTPVPIIPKFIDIVVNGMSDRGYKVNAFAQDPVSTTKRENFIKEMQMDMVAKEALLDIQKELGVSGFVNDPNALPETDEELEVHMELNYKENIEVAEEIAINSILNANEYEDVRQRVNYDLVTLGIGGVRREFDPSAGITLHYVDPVDTVFSVSKSPYMDDCYYFGEVRRISLADVKRINPNLTTEELEEISQSTYNWAEFNGDTRGREIDGTVDVLYFTYKTSKEIVYKEKENNAGGVRVLPRDDSFESPQTEDAAFKKLSRTIDVEYNGVMVLGSTKLIRWELAENMVREKSAFSKVIPTYTMARPRTYMDTSQSLLQRMIPFADLIQLSHLKLQQVLTKLVPDGVYLDADGLTEIDLGDGNSYNPTRALEMYFQTGSVIGRSQTSDGEFNHGSIPIKELNTSAGSQKIQTLIMSWNHYIQAIRDVTGLNEARDASTPNSESLVGVQKLAILNSNTATRHLVDASTFITRKLSQGISYMISDILEYPHLVEAFVSAIGRVNVNVLNDIKELSLYDFGIYIELAPDEEERADLDASIAIALQTGEIDLADKIDIKEIKNIKTANQLLKIRRKQKLQQEMEKQQGAIQAQTESNAQLAQQTAEAKMMEVQANTQSKMQVDTNLKDLEIRNMQAEVKAKSELMMLEFEINMKLKGLEVEGQKVKQDMKDEKDGKRQDKNLTAQSKMIDQRKTGGAPIDFESTEDSLDGFSLESFSPK